MLLPPRRRLLPEARSLLDFFYGESIELESVSLYEYVDETIRIQGLGEEQKDGKGEAELVGYYDGEEFEWEGEGDGEEKREIAGWVSARSWGDIVLWPRGRGRESDDADSSEYSNDDHDYEWGLLVDFEFDVVHE